MQNTFKKTTILIVLLFSLFVFALILRTYRLTDVPKSMHNDEIANTYAARFVLENKKDMYGNNFPLLYLDKFGDYPPVLAMYVSAAGTYIFGTNEFGSRIGIAFIGALFIIPLFLLANLIFNTFSLSVIVSLIACILPWHFILSRANAEGIVALTVYTWGLFLLLLSNIENTRFKNLKFILGILLFFLTYFIYPSYRIFIPTTLLGLLMYFFLEKKKIHILLFTSLIISLLITFYISQTFWGQGRFKQTSIFNEVSGVQILINELNFNEPNIITARIFNNKIIAFGLKYVAQYLDYFSPVYLFVDGGYSKAYTVPYSGLLYLSLIVITLFGNMFTNKKNNGNKQKNIKLLIFYILLTAPIASAFTYLDTPNNHRSLLMVLPILLYLCFPTKKILDSKNKLLIVVLTFIVTLESVFFFHNYFQHANLIESIYRNDGNKDAMMYVIKNKNKYNKVFVTNQELWLPANYLFFSNNYSKELIGKVKMNFRTEQIDNVFFPDNRCPDAIALKLLLQKTEDKFLVVNPEDCPVNTNVFEEILTIKRANFTNAFKIYQSKKLTTSQIDQISLKD